MKKSLAIGSFLGVLLTLGVGYYFYFGKIVEFVPSPSTPTVIKDQATGAAAAVEPAGIPITAEAQNFETNPPGGTDILAYRASRVVSAKPETLDKALDQATLPPIRTSPDCAFADLSNAIFVPTMYAEAVKTGRINMHFMHARIPHCFSSQSSVVVAVDDLLGDKTYYQLIGRATIERLYQLAGGPLPQALLELIGIDRSDVDFFANPLLGPMLGLGSPYIVMQYNMQSQAPILDPTTIPSFVPGAEVIKAESITKFFASARTMVNPRFVDARDRTNISHGVSYPGAIQAPFIAANPNQLRFQIDFPISALSGGRYDIRALPPERHTPLIIFGNDANDPAPLWMIRYLRLQNYRTLFFVEGGLKAMNAAKPVLPRPL